MSRFEGTCPSCGGKRVYRDRRSARAAAKQIPGTHMSAYRCPVSGWHLGHLPRAVVHGHLPKAVYVAGLARRSA